METTKQTEIDMKKINYLKSNANMYLSKNDQVNALDCYTQIYDIVSNNDDYKKKELCKIAEKIVKILNLIGMKLMKEGNNSINL